MLLFWGMNENTHGSDKGKGMRILEPCKGRRFRVLSASPPKNRVNSISDHILCSDTPMRRSPLLPGEAHSSFLLSFIFLKNKSSSVDTKFCLPVPPIYWLVLTLLCGSTQNWNSPIHGISPQIHIPREVWCSLPNLSGPHRLVSSAFFTFRTPHHFEGLY